MYITDTVAALKTHEERFALRDNFVSKCDQLAFLMARNGAASGAATHETNSLTLNSLTVNLSAPTDNLPHDACQTGRVDDSTSLSLSNKPASVSTPPHPVSSHRRRPQLSRSLLPTRNLTSPSFTATCATPPPTSNLNLAQSLLPFLQSISHQTLVSILNTAEHFHDPFPLNSPLIQLSSQAHSNILDERTVDVAAIEQCLELDFLEEIE